MNSGYDQFFKKSKEVKIKANGRNAVTSKKSSYDESKHEQLIREAFMNNKVETSQKNTQNKKQKTSKNKKTSNFSIKTTSVLLLIIFVAGYGTYDPGFFDDLLSHVEVGFMTASHAADEAKSTSTKSPKQEENASEKGPDKKLSKQEAKNWTAEDISYFSKLRDRKKQLDSREQELSKLEEELHKQKVEVEKRIVELQKIREQISTVLNEKVTVDQQKVDKLVAFYSNMKPKQAAKVIESIDEDLAVEVLAKMKKKNAADIMNLLKPSKAQNLSEKFAGYKRR